MGKEIKESNRIVSIMVLCFNNFKYLFEALDSVFLQTYPQIQLIVSDDASSDFDKRKAERYIQKHKGPNIIDFTVNQNAENLGTVKHLEYVRTLCIGDWLTSIAADDAYADPNAIKVLVDAYDSYDGQVPFITSLAVMSDVKLKKRLNVFTSDEDIDLINSGDTKRLFEELAYRCIMSASGTLVERDLYDKIGDFDDYAFIEDWSMHLRLARMGVPMKCVKYVTYLHRDGGVSHGNKRAAKKVFLRYYHDLLTLYEKEIAPYKDQMSKYSAMRAKRYYDGRSKRYEIESNASNDSGLPKLVFYCRKGIAAKGDFILYYRIASYVAEHYPYDVYCVNNSVPELQEQYLDSKIHFCDITPDNAQMFEGATFVVALNQVFCMLDEIGPIKNAKVLFLFLHPEIVHWLLIQAEKHLFHFKSFSRLCIRSHAYAFQDEANYLAYAKDGLPIKSPRYFPVIIDNKQELSDIAPICDKNVLNIAWLGRVDRDKVFSIVNCLENLHCNMSDREIRFHLLGDGNGKELIKMGKYAPNIKFVFCSYIFGEARDRYLRENVDLVLAMGMSALDIAILGIPIILPIVSMNPFDSNKFLYLFNTRNYCIGWKKEDLDSVDCHTDPIEKIISDIYDDGRKQELGKKCRDFALENFSIEQNVQNIMDLVEGTTLTKKKLLRNFSIGVQWKMFKAYQHFLRPGAQYVEFLTFKQKVKALRKQPLKIQIKTVYNRLKNRKVRKKK